MKRAILAMAVLTMLGCGGGAGNTVATDTSPVVGSVTFTPASAKVGSGDVRVLACAMVASQSPDMVKAKVMRLDPVDGRVVETVTWAPDVLARANVAQITAAFPMPTDTIGHLPFAVSVVDSQGRESAWSYGTFEVTQ